MIYIRKADWYRLYPHLLGPRIICPIVMRQLLCPQCGESMAVTADVSSLPHHEVDQRICPSSHQPGLVKE